MRCAKITDFFKLIKTEPEFDTEPFDSTITSSECQTLIKSEQHCYIKEEIDISPDETFDSDSDYKSLSRTCTNLGNRTCSIVIERLSDLVLQKYLTKKIQSGETIRRSASFTSLNNDNVESVDTNNKQKEIIGIFGKKEVKNLQRKDPSITKDSTSLNQENVQNSDTNNKQNKVIEDNGQKKVKKVKRVKKKDKFVNKYGPRSTQFYTSLCSKCNKKFISKTTMYECSDCKVRLVYECKKCHKQLNSHQGITNHVKRECLDEGYYYECSECGYKSSLKLYVSNHLKKLHPNLLIADNIKKIESKKLHVDVCDAIDECLKCGQKFGNFHKLTKHMQLCNGSKVKTLQEVEEDSRQHTSNYSAAKSMVIRKCLNCHEETPLAKIGPNDKKLCTKCHVALAFKCLTCQKPFNSCNGVVNHIIVSHVIKQEWSCSKCDFKCISHTYLTSHYKRMHDPKVHECPRCNKDCRSGENLKRHLKRCGVEAKFYCDHCSYKSSRREYLESHMCNVHPVEDKSVECPNCHTILKYDSVLKNHLRACGKEAHFQCNHCSFKTKWKNNIKSHIYRYHMAGSKYECFKCKCQFQNHRRLKQHLVLCGVERRVKCKICPYKTYRDYLLKCHMFKVHSKDSANNKNKTNKYYGYRMIP